VSAVQRTGVPLTRPIAIHCVSGEEDGGIGAYATVRRGHTAEACVIAEPTTGAVIPATAGALTFRLEVSGLATHGSTRARGVSAIEKFEYVHRALRGLESARNVGAPPEFAHLDLAWPLSVGVVRAGDWASTVPDRLVAEGRYGVRVDETSDQAIAMFESTLANICAADPWLADNPVRVEWSGGQFAPGVLAADHPLVAETCGVVEDVRGAAPPVRGAPYGSDLRHYVAAGVPTVQYGPGDVRYAHAVDEHVALADVVGCAQVYAALAVRRCAAP
jgi:acetylornithine deacetylase